MVIVITTTVVEVVVLASKTCRSIVLLAELVRLLAVAVIEEHLVAVEVQTRLVCLIGFRVV